MSDLQDYTVVALEQAVAAPYASNLLAEAGARVIKIERKEGDFSRHYDHVVKGESAYFVWLNRGKESVCLDIKKSEDKQIVFNMLKNADVFLQNLKPGAVDKLGLSFTELEKINPGLVMCSISGYGESGEYADMKAYDLLVQAESGLSSITGTADSSARVGVSLCDIATGLSAYAAILRALLARGKTGRGVHIQTSLFAVMADWMNVPLLHQAYGGQAPARMGIQHPSIAPYGAFTCGDGMQLVLSIQNEREWFSFCEQVLENASIATDPLFNSNVNRVANRGLLDQNINGIFSSQNQQQLAQRLFNAGIAYGQLNSLEQVLKHPQLQQITVDSPSGAVTLAATGVSFSGQLKPSLPVPALGQHSALVREEFKTAE
jgi:crotonobetainyl-CoA:carnitine CoA-transferase CaiB-like acyl-CoA transferase